ncbi:hypothetical protein DFH29DRAFT_160985 [Suillus ampliporus]|nr:hypothetical protein DFH29DRAFT_160985 [Suillus ampliporus]
MDREPQMKDYVPKMGWIHKFEEISTAKIQRAQTVDDAEWGSRVLYIIVSRKLLPITKLSGDEFLRAWWKVVVCHRILWEHGTPHRNINLSSLMFYRELGSLAIGVLNDYDLSSTQDFTPSRNERRGTLPFMAFGLLAMLNLKAFEGKVEHFYQDDAESLIWVLTWVCLRYEGGELLSKDGPLNEWLKVDALRCSDKKVSFMRRVQTDNSNNTIKPSSSHQSNWQIAQSCLRSVPRVHVPDDDSVFRTWFQTNVPSSLQKDK